MMPGYSALSLSARSGSRSDVGMVTMQNSLGTLYTQGFITYDAALQATFDKKEFVAKYG